MTHAPNKGQLIRADRVAAIIGVSPRRAAAIMQQMPRINIGSGMSRPRWAVYEADVQAWLSSRQVPAETPGQRQRRKRTIIRLGGALDERGFIPRRR